MSFEGFDTTELTGGENINSALMEAYSAGAIDDLTFFGICVFLGLFGPFFTIYTYDLIRGPEGLFPKKEDDDF